MLAKQERLKKQRAVARKKTIESHLEKLAAIRARVEKDHRHHSAT